MKTIKIVVRDKIAVTMDETQYICGNSDFVVNFDFDAEWDGFDVKTARFIKDDRKYQDVVFQGNDCPVPVLYNTNKVRVGVFAGNLRTSTPAIITANKGILCGNGSPEAPSEDVYAQIMEQMQWFLREEKDPTVPAWAKEETKPSYSKSEVGLGNVDNVKQYSASNPPPYPVKSVNGKTGAVNLGAADVGARPETWMPTATEVGALPVETKIPSKTSDLTNDSGFVTQTAPQMYGAKGDGTTDDTAAFQNALSKNRVVNVPGGTYLLSGTLVIRANCCLELSQDTILLFTQTSGNCIVMQGSATLRGNHAIISVPYAFTGAAVAMDTNLETDTIIPPYLKAGSHMFKRQRFVYDINIIKPDAAGFCRSDDGTCTGTAVYMSADSTTAHMWMWAINISGLRIAGGFNYGIHAINYDSPAGSSGHYEDDAWNHDMRIEAVIEACEIGVALENCNGAHLAVTIQPSKAQNTGAKYAKHGVYLNDSKFVDMIGSRVWDWNDKTTLWTMGGEYQHLALIGNCRGLLLDDFLVHETSTPIQELIYTDRPANFDTMSILQEPGSKYFKAVEGEPYFDTGTPRRLAMKDDIDEYFVTDRVPGFTDALATAIDTDGSIYNGIGYNKHGGALSSSGTKVPDTEAYYGHTGFVACKSGDTIYVNDIDLSNTDGYTKAFAYDADFNLLGQNGTSTIINGTTPGVFTGTTTGDGYTLTPVKGATAYMRLSFKSTIMGADPIISVNKEIKFEQAGFLADSIKVKAENVVGDLPGGGGSSVPADWNAAEGEPGHVLNRTHYIGIAEIISEMAVYDEDLSGYYLTHFTMTPGAVFFVTVNGTNYTLTAKEANVEGTYAVYLGAGALLGLEDADETPFILATLVSDEVTALMFADESTNDITITVKGEMYVPLPYEYIPPMKYVIKMDETDEPSASNQWHKNFDATELVNALSNDWPVWVDFSAKGSISEKALVKSWASFGHSLDEIKLFDPSIASIILVCDRGGIVTSGKRETTIFINMSD